MLRYLLATQSQSLALRQCRGPEHFSPKRKKKKSQPETDTSNSRLLFPPLLLLVSDNNLWLPLSPLQQKRCSGDEVRSVSPAQRQSTQMRAAAGSAEALRDV